MNDHLEPDALLTIGQALDWQVRERLQHLQQCDECRVELEAMRLARLEFSKTEAVDEAALQRIASAIAMQSRVVPRVSVGEGLVAGVAALIVLRSSGVDLGSFATAGVGFALGSLLMVVGTYVMGRVAANEGEVSHA